MNPRMLIAAACTTLLTTTACGRTETAPPAKSVVVLMDVSVSTASPQAREVYAQALEAVMATLKPGDAFYAGWITDRSAGELSLPVHMEVPVPTFHAKNEFYRKPERRRARAAACALVDEAYATLAAALRTPRPDVKKTHIMASLVLADRVFRKLSRPRNIVVLLSDMLEDSDRYDFEEIALNADARARIIAAERSANRLPELAGAHVYVVGASAGNDDRIFAVRDFWLEYFKAAGAQLLPEDYGPLIKFETDIRNDCKK